MRPRSIVKSAFLNSIQRRHIHQHEKNIEIFEQAFSAIRSSTGISDIAEIVKIFVRVEERNYSLLSYVNSLHREIQEMEKKNDEFGKLVEERKKDKYADCRPELKKRLADLKQQLEKAKNRPKSAEGHELENMLKEKLRPSVGRIQDMVEEKFHKGNFRVLREIRKNGRNQFKIHYFRQNFVQKLNFSSLEISKIPI